MIKSMRAIFFIVSFLLFVFLSAISYAAPVDLGPVNFNYFTSSSNSSITYQNGTLEYDIINGDGDWAGATYNEFIPNDQDYLITLDYSNFYHTGGGSGKIQIGFHWEMVIGNQTVNHNVKIQREYLEGLGDSYTAWYEPDYPPYSFHWVPTADTSGTFVIEKNNNDVKLYIDGNQDAVWNIQDVNFSGQFELEIDAWSDFGGSTSVDVSNLNIAVVPEPISSTLFVVGAATLGLRRFRKKYKK